MKKNEMIFVGILIAIFVVIIVAALIAKNNGTIEPENKPENKVTENVVDEKYVDVKDDGTKVNNSNKLKEAKKLGDLEISNITLSSKNNESYLQATVKNTGASKAGDDFITITIMDEQNQEIATIQAYLSTVEPGKEITLSTKASVDFANAYDFKVNK